MVGGDIAFQVRNALIVNTAFSCNSTGIYFSGVSFANSTTANNAAYLGGVAPASLSVNNATYATQATSALSANNSFNLGGVAAANYIANSGNYTLSGILTYSANVVLSAGLSANGSYGSANQVLTSNGTIPYWSTSLDTTNATNISSGTLNAARLPLDYTNATNISSGTLAQARLTNVLFTNVAAQTISGGARITSYSIGIVSSGTTTIDTGNGPLQYLTCNGAFTLAAPANDGSCVLLMTNGTGAGAVANSGFTVSASVGDALDTTNAHKFLWYILRINGVSTFTIKALQ